MEAKTVVDARGLNCPQPAMMARQTMRNLGSGTFEIMLDSGTAQDNVTRIARMSGWHVETEDMGDGEVRLIIYRRAD